MLSYKLSRNLYDYDIKYNIEILRYIYIYIYKINIINKRENNTYNRYKNSNGESMMRVAI